MKPIRLVSTKDMPKEDWLEWRKQGLGGSDVAAICGLSKYRSPVAVYLDKIGELPPIEDNPKMKAGRMLEPLIADWFTQETGIRVMHQHSIFQHNKHPFMLANIDRWVIGKNEGLEIKNTSEYCRADWYNGLEETIPTEYMLQANHYMAVTGADRWYVAVLIGGWDFQWRVIERDEILIKNLITIESNFWNNHVLAKSIPAFNAQDTDVLKEMYPDSYPTSIEFTESQYELIKNLIDAKSRLEFAKTDFEDAKNKVKAVMGKSELALWQGDNMFSWKSNKKGTRVFNILGGL